MMLDCEFDAAETLEDEYDYTLREILAAAIIRAERYPSSLPDAASDAILACTEHGIRVPREFYALTGQAPSEEEVAA
jgi:hypothetical protein